MTGLRVKKQTSKQTNKTYTGKSKLNMWLLTIFRSYEAQWSARRVPQVLIFNCYLPVYCLLNLKVLVAIDLHFIHQQKAWFQLTKVIQVYITAGQNDTFWVNYPFKSVTI